MADIWTPRAVALGVGGILFTLILVLCFVKIPGENQQVILVLTGSLGAAFGSIVQFYFGSSSSSRDKDATIKSALVGTNELAK